MSLTNHSSQAHAWLAVILLALPVSNLQAESDQFNVAREMAHAVVAHECGKSRTPQMTAGFQSGLYMAMNTLDLSKQRVGQILQQEQTMALTDTFSAQLFKDIEKGLTNCENVYRYVVQGLMPKLDIIGKQ